MEIKEQKQQDHQINCSKCIKKQQLIQKYQNLITLLKKKADRSQSQLSQSNKFSIGDVTTSHTSFYNGNLMNKYTLPLVLVKLQHKKYCIAYHNIKSQSYLKYSLKKQSFINKLDNLCKLNQKYGFNKLKLLTKQHQFQNILNSQSIIDNNQLIQQQQNGYTTIIKQRQEKQQNSPLNKKSIYSIPQNSLTNDQLNYKSLVYLHEDLITSCINKSSGNTLNGNILKQNKFIRQQSLPLLISKKSTSSTQQIKNLYKKLFVLEQQNQSYKVKIKKLEEHMQQALNRQIKQNRKKTQSLQMVAQQMAQKNQLIIQLQQKITMLQQKYQCQNNGVLQDQLTQNRKQIDKLQKVNIKLDNQLRKIKQKLLQTQGKLQSVEKDKQKLDKQNVQLKEGMFQMQQKIITLQKKYINFNKSCHKMQKIFQQLKYHKKLSNKLNKSTNKQSYIKPNSQLNKLPNIQIQQLQQQNKQSLQQFFRLELIFIYLYNIEDQTYSFSQHQHLFDEQQLEVLKQLKHKFLSYKLKDKQNQQKINNIDFSQYQIKPKDNFNRYQEKDFIQNQQNQQHNIYCPHQNMVDGSIFDVLIDHRQNNSHMQQLPKPTQRQQPQKNLTMKLLQMQIQKNKQIQKISELKQKNMYVRNIILNLMKSLQLRQNTLKNQTNGILDLIFDVFQYSEEEKHVIFTHAQPKEKKFFGFI